MIVDTSALIAILRDEPEAKRCATAIDEADVIRISSANYVEAAIVVDRAGDAIARRRFDELVLEMDLRIESTSASPK